MFAGHPATSVARMFLTRLGADGWTRLPLAAQCALPLKDRRVVGWLMVTGRLAPSPDYLVACRPYLGEVAAHHHRTFHERFSATSAELGFDRIVTRLQWSALVKVTALAGLSPEQATKDVIQEGREALVDAIGRHRPDSHGPKALSAALFGAQTTLFHLGVLDAPPRKSNRDRSAERAAEWASISPQLASTLMGYIAQVRLSLRAIDDGAGRGRAARVRLLAGRQRPEVACVADLRRRHIEAYKLHLAGRPSARGDRLTKTSLAEHLGGLRTCFERLAEWDGDDVPAAVLVFEGDLPLRDAPLPRFLDDGAFTKLLQATRADPDPFVRLAVEFLARTGLRKGEFLDLTVDSVVQIGAAYWLHVPVGKLRTDRYIPLHPQLKDAARRLARGRGRPASAALPVHRARPAHRAGPRRPGRGQSRPGRRDRPRQPAPPASHAGHPGHQPGHVARGDSRTARASIDAYDHGLCPHRQPHRRRRVLLGLGEGRGPLRRARASCPPTPRAPRCAGCAPRCTSGCSATATAPDPSASTATSSRSASRCTFFQTTIEFRPTLKRQRDDATAKGQVGRQKIFDGLLTRLDEEAS